MSILNRMTFLGMAMAAISLLASPIVQAGTMTVTTFEDELDDYENGPINLCSLREALYAANYNLVHKDCPVEGELGAPDTIILGPGEYILSIGGPIENEGLFGDFDILEDLIIQGAGSDQTFVQLSSELMDDVEWRDRIFDIHGAGMPPPKTSALELPSALNGDVPPLQIDLEVQLSGMTVRYGVADAGMSEDSRGGGIRMWGNGATPKLTLTDVLVTENNSTYGGGGIANLFGLLELIDSAVIDNETVNNEGYPGEANGGGIFNWHVLNMTRSEVSENTSGHWAGGIFNRGHAEILQSTIDGNTAGDSGGGIYAREDLDTLIVEESTISNNTSGDSGGGIGAEGTPVYITNSTISGNTADVYGGGLALCAYMMATLSNITVSNNTADFDDDGLGDGGGIVMCPMMTVTFQNSLIAGNFDKSTHPYEPNPILLEPTVRVSRDVPTFNVHPDCSFVEKDLSVIHSLGYNLIGDNRGCDDDQVDFPAPWIETDQVGNVAESEDAIDPQLKLLGENGGLTKTHALDPLSTAVDRANPEGCLSSDEIPVLLETDQRGEPRTADGDGDGEKRCDIGAYELQPSFCGDGIKDDGEDCDDGDDNSDVLKDACRTDCSKAHCGDGVVDTGEDCDGGGVATDTCNLDCTIKGEDEETPTPTPPEEEEPVVMVGGCGQKSLIPQAALPASTAWSFLLFSGVPALIAARRRKHRK